MFNKIIFYIYLFIFCISIIALVIGCIAYTKHIKLKPPTPTPPKPTPTPTPPKPTPTPTPPKPTPTPPKPTPTPPPKPTPTPGECCIPQDWASVGGVSGQNQKYWDAGGPDVCSCGQWSNYYLSKKYITPEGAEEGSFCPSIYNPITANTQAFWSNHGSNKNPLMKCNSTDKNQNCCWWGRGAIQLTGQHNYYIFNNALQKIYSNKYDDLCKNPQQICPPKPLEWGQPVNCKATPDGINRGVTDQSCNINCNHDPPTPWCGPPYNYCKCSSLPDYDDKIGWLAGIFFWENQVQTPFTDKYWVALNKFIMEDWTQSTSILVKNALNDITNWARCVSSVINLGVWEDNGNDPDGIESRLEAIYNIVKYFDKSIDKFSPQNLSNYLNNLDSNDLRQAAYPDIKNSIPDCRQGATQNNCPILFKTQNLPKIINDYNSNMSNQFKLSKSGDISTSQKQSISILAGFLGNIIFETGYLTTCDETIWTTGPGDTAQAGHGTCYNPTTGIIDKCDEWQHEMCYYTGDSNLWNKPRKEIHPFMCAGKDDLPVCK